MNPETYTSPRGTWVKIRCFKETCRHNVDGECSREEIRVDELGICIDSRPTTQYPQEFIRKKRQESESSGDNQ